jgi:hypothetical protein
MYAALIRGRQVAINKFDLEQIEELRIELDNEFKQQRPVENQPHSRNHFSSRDLPAAGPVDL